MGTWGLWAGVAGTFRPTCALLLTGQQRVISASHVKHLHITATTHRGNLWKSCPVNFLRITQKTSDREIEKQRLLTTQLPLLFSPWDWFQVRLCGTRASDSSQSLFSEKGKQLPTFRKLFTFDTLSITYYHVCLEICIWILALPLPESHWLRAFVCLCVFFSSSCFN